MVLKDGVTDTSEEVEAALRKLIKTQIGSFAVPNTILVSPRECLSNKREK